MQSPAFSLVTAICFPCFLVLWLEIPRTWREDSPLVELTVGGMPVHAWRLYRKRMQLHWAWGPFFSFAASTGIFQPIAENYPRGKKKIAATCFSPTHLRPDDIAMYEWLVCLQSGILNPLRPSTPCFLDCQIEAGTLLAYVGILPV